jgi:chemotaxis protein CheC
MTETNILSDDERDILQEIMNIAFGSATEELVQVIDIYIHMNVPEVQVMRAKDLPVYIHDNVSQDSISSVVEQKFWGDFKGSGVLVFPGKTDRDLVNLLDNSSSTDDILDDRPLQTLQHEVLMEIGNILIGACVGKISDLLNTFVTYSPPQTIIDSVNEFSYLADSFSEDQTAIILKAVFEFEKKNLNGLLFILTNEESMEWLRQALVAFMEQY